MEFQVKYLFLLFLFTVTDRTEWFWMASLLKNIQDPFLVLHFSYYTLMTFLMILPEILLYVLMVLFSILSMVRHLICGNNLNQLLNLNLSARHCGVEQEKVFGFQWWENSSGFV